MGQTKWGETMNQFNKYGVHAGDTSFDQPSYFDANIAVDNKGISPITQSPRDKDFMNSKDNSHMWEKTLKYLDNMDSIRQTNWKNVLLDYDKTRR